MWAYIMRKNIENKFDDFMVTIVSIAMTLSYMESRKILI
jgi:hypothetical protein